MNTLDKLIAETSGTKEKLIYSGVKLFSTKGYANVGIRTLCSSVGIKESSFYNHFKSKEGLFRDIMGLLTAGGDRVMYSEEAIAQIPSKMPMEAFLMDHVKRIQAVFQEPVFSAVMRLIVMESYVNPIAYELSVYNNYDAIADVTVRILSQYMDKGEIIDCNLQEMVQHFHYGLNAYNETYLLNDAWGKDQAHVLREMEDFTKFFIKVLKGEFSHE